MTMTETNLRNELAGLAAPPRSTPKDESGKPDPVTDLNHVLEDLCLHFDLVPAEELARKLAAVSDPSLRL